MRTISFSFRRRSRARQPQRRARDKPETIRSSQPVPRLRVQSRLARTGGISRQLDCSLVLIVFLHSGRFAKTQPPRKRNKPPSPPPKNESEFQRSGPRKGEVAGSKPSAVSSLTGMSLFSVLVASG